MFIPGIELSGFVVVLEPSFVVMVPPVIGIPSIRGCNDLESETNKNPANSAKASQIIQANFRRGFPDCIRSPSAFAHLEFQSCRDPGVKPATQFAHVRVAELDEGLRGNRAHAPGSAVDHQFGLLVLR